MLRRPDPDEYDDYYGLYVGQVPEGDVLEVLAEQVELTGALVGRFPADLERSRYAPGKWSVREVVGHLVDVERVFAERALWFARASDEALPGIDQDRWAEASNADDRPLADLFAEFALTRMSCLAMFRGFDDATWLRRGTASGCEFSVRAIPFILADHEIHHRRVLEERYLKPLRERGA